MKTIHFQKETSGFHEELLNQVNAYFEVNRISRLGNRKMKVKILSFFMLYIMLYAALFLTEGHLPFYYSLLAILGGLGVVLGLNIGHDAAHNAIFKKQSHNKRLLFIFEILGTSSYNWVNRHLGAHHIYPNVMNYDSDIQQTKVVKIFPKDKHLLIHNFQYLYMPIVYLAYIFRWIVYRDFKDVWSKNIGVYQNKHFPLKQVFKMILFKVFYLTQMIVLPVIFLDISWGQGIIGFLFLTCFGSLVITFVLLSTHVGEDANFPEPDYQGIMPHSWSYHQVLTAADFGTKSTTLNLLFGGFNHHVIHHLFPHICHIHYPNLTPILKAVSLKYEYPYRGKKFLLAAVISHFKLLKKNGSNLNSTNK
jgi:linoleoyl-CoA desaturase